MKEYRISTYCYIKNHQVIVDDQVVFTSEKKDSPNSYFKEIYQHLQIDYPKYHKMDLLCKGAFLAAEYINHKKNIQKENVALVFSNYSSSYISDKKHTEAIFDIENPIASPAIFVYTLPNIILGELSIRHQLHSENIFYIFDSFTPDFLVPHNENMLNQNKADKILSGWVEVTESEYDIFLYLLEKEGKEVHTPQNIRKLYNK